MKKVLLITAVCLAGCSKKDKDAERFNYACTVAEYVDGNMVKGSDSSFYYTGTEAEMTSMTQSMSDSVSFYTALNGKHCSCRKTQ